MAGQGKLDPVLMTVEAKHVFWLLGFSKCTVVTGYPAFEPKKKKEKREVPPELVQSETVQDEPNQEGVGSAPESETEPGSEPETPVDGAYVPEEAEEP